jgi:GT2 family glycosyltransferase
MIGFVILNYNTWEMTIRCVDSILNTCQQNYSIYIVDNGSKNDSYHNLKEHYKESNNVIVINSGGNLGYARGNNVGIRYALKDGLDIITVVNNDVIFLEESINHMYTFLKKNHDVAAVSPYILSPDGEVQNLPFLKPITIRDYLFYSTRLSRFSTSKQKQQYTEKYLLSENSIGTYPIPIYKFSGCCFMAKREMLEDVGLFDENTFLYYEEDILCHKMYKSGYKAYFLPNAEIVHHHGLTTGKANLFVDTEMLKSEMYFLSSYYHTNFFVMFLIYIDRVISPFVNILKKHYKVTFKDYLAFLRVTWKHLIKN